MGICNLCITNMLQMGFCHMAKKAHTRARKRTFIVYVLKSNKGDCPISCLRRQAGHPRAIYDIAVKQE